jgi:hypothetical protein
MRARDVSRRIQLILALLALTAASLWLLRPHERPESAPASPAPAPTVETSHDTAQEATSAPQTPPVPDPSQPAAAGQHSGRAPVPASDATPPAPTLAPDQAMEAVRLVIRNYGLRFKGNPVGNNAEITSALSGDNPHGVQFLDPDVHRVNERGELVDTWDTPYFFHQLSAERTEIHSAGPDRRLWTADDLVTR